MISFTKTDQHITRNRNTRLKPLLTVQPIAGVQAVINSSLTGQSVTCLPTVFNKNTFHSFCDQLSQKEDSFKFILDTYGYPPMWQRPNTFATLVHIILEQQVSLQSAKAAFIKLGEKLGTITPAKLLQLSDEELRACYFSRQKTGYVRHLAEMILTRKVNLQQLLSASNDTVRESLTQVKGIGNWSCDIYLLFVLQRLDVFPLGDLAMVNALRTIRKLDKTVTKEKILEMAINWQPYRSIATMLLWHYYIQTRNIHL